MRPVNILIYEPYPFGKVCGNLRTLSYILEFVNKKAFNIYVVVPFETDFTMNMRKQNVHTITLKPHERLLRYGGGCLKDNFWGRLLNTLYVIPYSLNILGVIKEKKIDVIYCNGIRSLLLVAIAAKVSKVPMLWYIKGELQNSILDRIGFVLADRILFFCHTNKHDKYPGLVKMYQKKIDILKIGIDPEPIKAIEKLDKAHIRQQLSIDENKINLACVGQLYPSKGVHHLLAALSSVIERSPNIMLYVIGDHVIDEYASYKDELQVMIEKNNLQKHVFFTGWRSDALEIVSMMDILVHPSLAEGFGRAVLEAMAFGKPVIASKVGGLREVIRDGENGFWVDPGDSESMAKKLSILVEDKYIREKLGLAAKKTVFSGYLIQDKISQLEKIWESMASGHQSTMRVSEN